MVGRFQSSSFVTKSAFTADAILILLNLFPVGNELVDDLVNLDMESNLAVWVSSAKLLVAALLAGSLASQVGRLKWPMRAAALLFLAISISETATLHERLGGVAYWKLHGTELSFGGAPWILYFAPAVMAALLALIWAMKRLSAVFPSATLWLWCGVGLWCGALVAEVVPFTVSGVSANAHHYLPILEESCELVGASCFLAGLLCIRDVLAAEPNSARLTGR